MHTGKYCFTKKHCSFGTYGHVCPSGAWGRGG